MSYTNECYHIEMPFQESPGSKDTTKLNHQIKKLEHDLFFLYVFLTSNELSEEACSFLESHEDDPVPFRMYG